MQLEIPIITIMLLISDNLKHWSPSRLQVAKDISIIAFSLVGKFTNGHRSSTGH